MWNYRLLGYKIGAIVFAVLAVAFGTWFLLSGVVKTAMWTRLEVPITKLESDRKRFMLAYAVARPNGESTTIPERLNFSAGSTLLQRSMVSVYCRPPTFDLCLSAPRINDQLAVGAYLLIFGSLILLVLRRTLVFLFERILHFCSRVKWLSPS